MVQWRPPAGGRALLARRFPDDQRRHSVGRTGCDRGGGARIHGRVPRPTCGTGRSEARRRFAGVHWTLTGTNTGPGGTGRLVRISGFEQWTMSSEGLIAASVGSFDAAEWDRQVNTEP